jgi:hypothetical protein
MKKRQRRGTQFSKDGCTVFVKLRVDRRYYEFARFWAFEHAVGDPAGTAEDHLEGYLNAALSDAIAETGWEAPAEIDLLYGPILPPKVVQWKGVKMVVPAEFRGSEIKTPEQAAELSADVIGVISVQRARKSMSAAQEKGWVRIARFYEAMWVILKEWYPDPPPDDPPDDPDEEV